MKDNKKRILTALILVIVFVSGVVCGDLFSTYLPLNTLEIKKQSESPKDNINTDTKKTLPAADNTNDTDKRAQEILNAMTLDEKIYQMLFVTPESLTGVGTCIAAGQTTKEAIEKMPVGGIIYFSENVQNKDQLTQMIKNTQSYSKLPLFIGVDEEGGQVRRLGSNEVLGMEFVGDMADIGRTNDTSKAYAAAKTIASSLNEFGFNVDFAPVADVYKNKENTVVKRRSFGSDTNTVSKMSLAFVNGLQDNNISACLKHFPGHGATAGDTHDGYSENTFGKDEILKDETAAFKKGIDGGCDFVMSGHISASALTGSQIPCSLSKAVVTDILKNGMNFKNIVITDAMNMGAISKNYSAGEAVVMAVEAGNDMVLMPGDINEAFDALKKSVQENKISEEQINESVKRILLVKIKRKIIN